MLIRDGRTCVGIGAWSVPDIGVDVLDPHAVLTATRSARVALSLKSAGLPCPRQTLDTAMAVLPLNSLVTLMAYRGARLDEQFWLRHAQRWPLLQSVHPAPPAERGFREMLLQDDGGCEYPLLPSLIRLDLIGVTLSAHRTLHLCEALMQRVE